MICLIHCLTTFDYATFLYRGLAATIGLGGVQLFVDAGLPVDRDLVTNLIREVITENVSTILGHPKPRSRRPSSKVIWIHSPSFVCVCVFAARPAATAGRFKFYFT